jgi:hypothetical protein
MTEISPEAVLAEVARIEAAFPAEFLDGFKSGLDVKVEGRREPGNYPAGFHGWPLVRRNAWFAGANRGLVERAEREKGGKL